MYINKVWIHGQVKTHPRIRNVSDRTKLTAFTISVIESWESRDGETRHHRNDIPVEVLGREAEHIHDNVRPGDWVAVDGYIRTDQYKGREQLKIRVFNIEVLHAQEGHSSGAVEEGSGGA